MGEILQIHIGQAGIRTGREVWDLLSQEKSIEKNGKLKKQIDFQQNNESLIHQLFDELPSGKYVPRCIFMDMEPTCIDQIKMGESRALFNSDSFINGYEDGITCTFTGGQEIICEALEQIRKQVEKCCSFQGFVINHSICGGTGSGIFHSLLGQLYDYKKKLKTSFSLFPSMYLNENIGNYNAVFALEMMNSYYLDLVVCFDNQALYNTLQQEDQIDVIQYKDINRLIAQMQSALLNTQNMNGIIQNLVPDPHTIFTYGTSQPTYLGSELGWKLDKLVKQSFLNNNQFLSVKKPGKMFSGAVLGRGDIVPMNLRNYVNDVKDTLNFADWVPKNISIYQNYENPMLIQDDESKKIQQSLSVLQNNSGILDSLTFIHKGFSQLFNKKAFTHWYVHRGIGEREFVLVMKELERVIERYEELLGQEELDQEELDQEELDQEELGQEELGQEELDLE